jgi:hypothetical protein
MKKYIYILITITISSFILFLTGYFLYNINNHEKPSRSYNNEQIDKNLEKSDNLKKNIIESKQNEIDNLDDLDDLDDNFKFNLQDVKYIPYSSAKTNNTLNNYVTRPKKITNTSFISNILDSNQNYNHWNHVFEFPYNDSRKSIENTKSNFDFDINKNYTSFFQPIIYRSKQENKLYKIENNIQKKTINNPFDLFVHPKHIQTKYDYNPTNKDNTLMSILKGENKNILESDPYFPRVYNTGNGEKFKCPRGFMINEKNSHRLLSTDEKKSIPIACRLL